VTRLKIGEASSEELYWIIVDGDGRERRRGKEVFYFFEDNLSLRDVDSNNGCFQCPLEDCDAGHVRVRKECQTYWRGANESIDDCFLRRVLVMYGLGVERKPKSYVVLTRGYLANPIFLGGLLFVE
jgi:hypothetical protein